MAFVNSTNIEMKYEELDKITSVLSEIARVINYINILPMGFLGPLLSVSLLLYTTRAYVRLQRRHRADNILFNQENCREEELKLRELNYTVNKKKYVLMLLVSLAELSCLLIPLGPFLITILNNTTTIHYFGKKQPSCEQVLIMNLMTQHISARMYIAFSRATLFVFLSLLRLLVTYLTNAYRERLRHTNFRKHFIWLCIITFLMVELDIIRYTFVPNLFISLLIILMEYVLLWRSLKDLRWATKWKVIDLERDHPNESKTKSFKMGSRVYRIFSHLLAIGIFNVTLSLLFLFNIIPIFDFLTHTNYYLHAIYPIQSRLFINLTVDCSIIKLISQILYIQLNVFVTLTTLATIYPFSLYFAILIVNDFILWLRRRNQGYPVRRPEIITSLLEWHRQYYVYKHFSPIIM